MLRFALGLVVIFFAVFLPAMPKQALFAQESGLADSPETYSREELSQMLAPIALYPDALLAQILMASTYPIEVVEADRWVRKNSQLKDETLDRVLLEKDWSPSVKALCHFPAILSLMSERISETTNLGNAFLAQEGEVMGMVQELRAKARAQGNLTTTDKQKVIVEREIIVIEPVNPRIVYVPYYDPFHVYGPWWYPAYPPYYWGPRGVSVRRGVSYWPAFYFSFSFGSWSYFDWHQHYIYIDVQRRPRYVRHEHWVASPGPWQHDPKHRRGVVYVDRHTASKYGQPVYRSEDYRRDSRDFSEQQGSGRERPGGERSRFEQERRGDDRDLIDNARSARERAERDRQERARVESALKERARIDQENKERDRLEKRDPQKRQMGEQERQNRERVEPEKKNRERPEVENKAKEGTDRERQVHERLEREQQEGARVETDLKERVEREQQNRERADRDRQDRERAEHELKERARIEQERQERERSEARDLQKRQQEEQDRQERERAEHELKERSRIEQERGRVEPSRAAQEDGAVSQSLNKEERMERESSERSRGDRHGRDRDSRSNGRPEKDDSGEQVERGRNNWR